MMAIPNRVRVLAVMLALALVGGLLTLALLAKPSQAKPPTDNENRGANSQQFGIDTTLGAGDCIGEDMHVTGTVHFVDQIFETDGGYHLHTHYNLTNGKAVGLTSGEEYIITAAGGTMENFVPTGDTVVGSVDTQVIIGKGQADGEVAHLQIHYIIEVVDGEPTTRGDTENVVLKCQPGNVTPPPATASATAAASAADTKASPTATKASPTATSSPGTGGAPLAMGTAVLLVGAGLAVRRFF